MRLRKKEPVASIELPSLIGLHLLAAKPCLVEVNLLSYETCGGTVVLCARNGSARARQARPPVVVRSRNNNNECWAIEVIGQDWSSEVVALFLEDWDLGRVALSCHMAMDVLCQEMRDACWVSSESVGSLCSL